MTSTAQSMTSNDIAIAYTAVTLTFVSLYHDLKLSTAGLERNFTDYKYVCLSICRWFPLYGCQDQRGERSFGQSLKLKFIVIYIYIVNKVTVFY